MFLKPIKLKSNNPLRGNEAKKFRQKLEKEFPNAKIDLLIPTKSYVNVLKIATYVNFQTNVYCVDKLPMFFENEGGALVPTLYALWKVEDLLPYFTTLSAVIPKLLNGADLMLPGVIPQGTNMNIYGRYKKDQLVAINITSNLSAVGVGYLARSSEDLYMCGGKGVAIKMLHIMGDKLWGLEPALAQQAPLIPPKKLTTENFPELGKNLNSKGKPQTIAHCKEEQPTTLAEIASATNAEMDSTIESKIEAISLEENNVGRKEENEIQTTLEERLKNAFLAALKNNGKSMQLPILISNFYRNYVVPETDEPIDLKKTKYKKLSNFLNEMTIQEFIVTKEETKGVDKIIAINNNHPEIINFITDFKKSSPDDEANKPLFHSELQEMYLVSDSTAPFFTKMSYKRGEGISEKDVKKIVRNYIKEYNIGMEDESNKIYILDDTLRQICDAPLSSIMSICNCLLSEMTCCYQMNSAGGGSKVSNKPIIQMSLGTRSGNKKVTLISNVDCYGIVMTEFIKQCKEGAAASVSIVKLPHAKKEQIQIQGNQIRFVYNLLTEKYKIPTKCISGLELARKEKRPKK